jgi:hypothetical protein
MPFNDVHLVARAKSFRWLAGICMGALPLLAPAPASALSFSFSFNNFGEPPLTGVITGLADSADAQTGPPVNVSITSGPAQTLGTYTYQASPDSGPSGDAGFSTSNGEVILKEIPSIQSRNIIWTGVLPSPTVGEPPIGFLRFARPTQFEELAPLRFGSITANWSPVLPSRSMPIPDGLIAGPVRFAVVPDPNPAEVPGPLPLLGAAAAFGYSRKVRHRIQQQKQGQEGSDVPHQEQGGKGP